MTAVSAWTCADRDARADLFAPFVYAELYAQNEGESEWRKTRFGWVDSSGWHHPARVEFERRVELIHPLVFSALLILISIAVLIWASEEYQWSRLVQGTKSGPLDPDPPPCRAEH